MTTHRAVAPVIEALNALAEYRPASAADLGEVLRSIHDLTGPCLIDALADALRALGWSTPIQAVTDRLDAAAGHLYALGADDIDRARADTGHFLGTTGTDSYL